MSQERIGQVLDSDAAEEPTEGVAFSIPYGDRQYSILFSNQEMDAMLGKGFEKILGNMAVTGFDYEVELNDINEILYVGAYGINTARSMYSKSGGHQEVDMQVGIVTKRGDEREHRGILSARRDAWDGNWLFLGYEINPPLKSFEDASDEQDTETSDSRTPREAGIGKLIRTIRRIVRGDERPLYQQKIRSSFPSAEGTFPWPMSIPQEDPAEFVVKIISSTE